MQSFAHQRQNMVERQIASRGIRDEHVLTAMRTVPREEFISDWRRKSAYEDSALPIEKGQTISQPYIVALMIEAAQAKPGQRILEVGAGSGYAAAVLSRIAARVYAMEWHHALAELAQQRMKQLGYDNVHVRQGDGTLGWPQHAPYDAIIVSAGGRAEIPRSLMDQLKVGGRLVIPVGDEPRRQQLLRITRVGPEESRRESLGRVQFVPLVGSQGW